MKILTRASAVVAATALVVTVAACSPSASALTPANALGNATQTTSTGQDANSAWAITRVDGAWQVTLHLAEPAPVRDAPSMLAVDGRLIGAARESGDRRTLTVVTDDPTINPRGRVTLWAPGDATAVQDEAAGGGGSFAPTAPVAPPAQLLATDPGVS